VSIVVAPPISEIPPAAIVVPASFVVAVIDNGVKLPQPVVMRPVDVVEAPVPAPVAAPAPAPAPYVAPIHRRKPDRN
jgi:hypothetical protein